MRRIKTKFLGKDKVLEIDDVPYVCVAVSDYRKLLAVARAADAYNRSTSTASGPLARKLMAALDKLNAKTKEP